jgi:hypothetical protein
MITIILGFLAKYTILERIKGAITFIIAHWRVFLIGLILTLSWHYYNKQVKRADSAIADKIVAEKALLEHVTADSLLAEKTIAENKLKEDKAREALSVAEVTANNQIDVIIGKEQTILQLSKKLEATYAQKSINYNLSHSGIVLQSESNLNSASEASTNSSAPASSEQVTDPACFRLRAELETLENACALTTVYYNEARTLLEIDRQ